MALTMNILYNIFIVNILYKMFTIVYESEYKRKEKYEHRYFAD